MSWQKNLDKQSRSVLLQQAATEQEAAARKPVVDPLITERISYINNRAPWIPANTQLSLAKNYASDDAVDKAAELHARNLNDNPDSVQELYSPIRKYLVSNKVGDAIKAVNEGKPVDRNFFERSVDNLYSTLKQTSRATGALGASIPEALQTVFSLGTLGTEEGRQRSFEIKDALDSFSLFQLLNNWDDQGDGFFLSEELMAQQSEAARRIRGTINGSAFTIGRGVAGTLNIPENSRWHTGVSGFLDFMVSIAAPDPNKYLFGGLKAAGLTVKTLPVVFGDAEKFTEALQFARGVVPVMTKADAGTYRKALEIESGLIKSLDGVSLDAKKWDRFMSVNPTAVKALRQIAEESDELALAERFNWKLAPEMIQRLAKAKTVDKVKAELIGNYTIGTGSLSTRIQDIQPSKLLNPIKYGMQIGPLKNSRLLTQLSSDQIVINGDDVDRIKAVQSMVNSLKTAGATRERLSEFTKEALDKFKAISASDDQRDAYKVYELYLKETLNLNGVRDETIDLLFQRAQKRSQKLRSYMTDRMGVETDNGFMKTYGDMIKKYFPPSVWNEYMEKAAELGNANMAFARPMQLSQLFDRVQTLPDPRELRRLTSNPLFRDALNTIGLQGKITKPIFSKRSKIMVKEIVNQERYDEITAELGKYPANEIADDITRRKVRALEQEQERLVKRSTKRVHTGEQAVWVDIIDGVQNLIWKPLNLATVGYIMRNSIDAQLRMALGAGTGFLNHPGEYISLLIGETKAANKLIKLAKKYDLSTKQRSILGEQLTVKGPQLFGKDKEKNNEEIRAAWKELREEHSDLLQLSSARQGLGTTGFGRHLRSTKDWRTVSRADGRRIYAEAALDSLRLSNSDELQRTAARGLLFNKAEDEILDELSTVADKAENFRQIDGAYKRGIPFVSRQGDEIKSPGRSLSGLPPQARREWLRSHSRDIPYANIKNETGEFEDVLFIAAFDRVPLETNITLTPNDFVIKRADQDLKPGAFVKLKKSVDENETDAVVMAFDGKNVVVRKVLDGSATGQGSFNYHPDAIKLINRIPVTDDLGMQKGLPLQFPKEMTTPNTKEGKAWLASTQEKLDDFTDFFFSQMYGQKWAKTLERSPVFRKFYYDEIANHIDKLSASEAQGLITKLKQQSGGDIGKYIGSKETAAKLQKVAATPGNGTLTVKDLDDYARLVGVSKTKGLLYDASSRNNLEDSLRIIFPFIGAWREIIGTYAGLILEDPTRLTRGVRYAGNLGQADPDGDGRGFWYQDPQSKQMFFKFPMWFGLPAALKAAGVDSFFEAPVSQLSQGMSWIPGLGPLAQIPASFLLRNKPETSKIVEILLPYGKAGISKGEIASQINPLPGVANKLISLMYSWHDENNNTVNNAFATTLNDVARAKYASGDYDLTTKEGFAKLEKDSLRDARIITAIRIGQQFFGPTSPQVGYKVELKDKDIYVDQLVQVFSKMQEEDYETAVTRFTKVFGEEAALYVGSKTESLVNGLEATGEFGEWELKNRDLMEDYEDLAAYFGPTGSEFNQDVYNRQKSEGKRRSLKLDELVELAQNRIGSAKFRAARKMFPAFPSEAQSEKLRAYRTKLHQEYPGFPEVAEFTVGEFDNQLILLKEIIKDPRLANNEVAPLVARYLSARESLLEGKDLKSFNSKKAKPVAESLYSFGNRLAQENPQFDRIWQRLLSSEVEK